MVKRGSVGLSLLVAVMCGLLLPAPPTFAQGVTRVQRVASWLYYIAGDRGDLKEPEGIGEKDGRGKEGEGRLS